MVSGKSDAGGGDERSMSADGNGSCGIFVSDRGTFSCVVFFAVLLAVAALNAADCSAASPSFARSSDILFLALSPSTDFGCCRMTSL